MGLPQDMKAVYYTAPREMSIAQRPVPQVSGEEVLVKIKACGLCGTDQHIHNGEFIVKFPVCLGHEAVGVVEKMGPNVPAGVLNAGDRVVCDNTVTCGNCANCVRGKPLFCENFEAAGVTFDGGFSEYAKYNYSKLFKIHNLTDIEACLVEPAACALHGADVLNLPVGADVLVIGAGPTGLLLAQLLKLNGAARLTLAANAGMKMNIAKDLGVADEYIELNRQDAKAQWAKLKEDNPAGFDAVVEATGVESIVNDSINYVRKGGQLLVYAVYDKAARVSWAPDTIFEKEITIKGSFAQVHCFPRAVAYLDSGKVKVKGMVTDVFKIEEYQDALAKVASRQCLKVAIAPGEYTK